MNPSHEIRVGDSLDLLRQMPDRSVHTCVTSPPYYGLRDYGVDGQIGLEQTPAEFIARLVAVFAEVRRVLRDDGTCWVNMGDSYASNAGGYSDTGSRGVSSSPRIGAGTMAAVVQNRRRVPSSGLKAKDLMGMPWRLAFALQDDGWYLRQDIIWHKPNPMPESTRDRCTKAHEYLFLLSKSRRYYCDMTAIREPAAYGITPTGVGFGHGTDAEERSRARIHVPAGWDTGTGSHGSFHRDGSARAARDNFKRDGSKREQAIPGQNTGTHRPDREESSYDLQTRNKRSVWTVATHAFKEAHFATFPPDLIRPCIIAGAPRGGLVLDPFGGAGTTGLVAMQEGRRSILCELNPEYAALARARLETAWLDGAAQMDVFLDQEPAA